MIQTKIIFFSKHQNKAEFKNPHDSGVLSSDFSGLKTSATSLTSSLQPRWPLQPQKPYFTKELPDSDGWIILDTKMTNSCQFLWNSSSKIQFFTDFSTFSAGGCWGQPMLLFWKLGQETQMSTPPEATRHHISTQLLVLLHLRAIYFSTFQYETPCKSNMPIGYLFDNR